MRRFYQAVVDIIQGGVHRREVALAVALGLLAGFLSGWNLCLAVVLLVMLVLNVPSKVFSEAWALGWALSWTVTPVSFAIGRWLLEKSPLGAMLAPWRDHPLLVLFDLDRYALLGGACLGLAIMLPAAWLAAKATGFLQTQFLQMQAALAANTAWEGKLAVRIGCWLIFGNAEQPALAPVVNPRWFRPRGMWLVLGLMLPAILIAWRMGPGLTTRGLLTAMSTANESEVNASRADVSFSEGLLEMEDLQVSDPDHPDRDRLRIGYVAAQVRPGALVRGRVHVDRLFVQDVQCNVARQTRARPYGVRLPQLDIPVSMDPLPNLRLPENVDALDVADYVAQWEQQRERLARLQQLIERIEELSGITGQDDEADYDPTQHVPAGYLAMREARHSFGRREPTVLIEMASLKGLAGDFGLGPQGSIELVNVSNLPALTGQPTMVAIKAPDQKTEILATLNLHKRGSPHQLRFQAADISLAALVQPKSSRPALAMQGGTINLAGEGWLTAQEFQLAIQAELKDFQVHVQTPRSLAGLPPQVWNDGLAQLNYLQTDATLSGRWTSPKLRIDTDRLVQYYKQQLLSAGQAALVKAIDDQLARGEAAVNQVVDSTVAKAEAAVDRQAAKMESTVDQAATRVDAAVAQGAAGVAQTQQRAMSQADQAVQQWQGQFGSAGRYLQENVAAGALTNPLGAAMNPAPVSVQGQPELTDPYAGSYRGQPQVRYGETTAAAPVENYPVQQPAEREPAAPLAVAPSESLRYPESVRNYAAQALPEPASPYQPPVVQNPPLLAQTPESLPAGYSAPNRPASFQTPPSRLELGYEERLAAQEAASRARLAARPSSPAPITAAEPPAEKSPSKIATWSRGVTSKVKSVMPWQKKDVSQTDQPVTPAAQAAAVEPTRPEPEGDNSKTPWYRRFWR